MVFRNPLHTITVPEGATTGPRIVIDGDTGIITVYSDDGIVAEIDDTGITVTDPNTGASITLDPTSDAYIELSPMPSPPGAVQYESGSIQAFGNGGPDYRPGLNISSPAVNDGGWRPVQLILDGGGATPTTDNSRLRIFADIVDFTPIGGNSDPSVRIRDREVSTAPLACFYTTAGTVVSCPAVSGAETAMANWAVGADANVTVGPGRIAKLSLDVGLYHADTAAAMCQVRIRESVNSPTANALGFFRFLLGAEGSNVPGPFHGECYVKNTDTSFDSTFQPGLTVSRVTGNAVAHSLYGDGNIPCRIVVQDMGLITDNPALANISATLVS